MKIESRKTYAFVDLRVDEIRSCIYKSDPKEIEETINNLLDVIDDLAKLNDESVIDYVTKAGYNYEK